MNDQFDDFHDVDRPAMARGDFVWRGVAVVVSDMPRLHVGDGIVPRHPAVRWLCRFRLVRALGVRPFLPGPGSKRSSSSARPASCSCHPEGGSN